MEILSSFNVKWFYDSNTSQILVFPSWPLPGPPFCLSISLPTTLLAPGLNHRNRRNINPDTKGPGGPPSPWKADPGPVCPTRSGHLLPDLLQPRLDTGSLTRILALCFSPLLFSLSPSPRIRIGLGAVCFCPLPPLPLHTPSSLSLSLSVSQPAPPPASRPPRGYLAPPLTAAAQNCGGS